MCAAVCANGSPSFSDLKTHSVNFFWSKQRRTLHQMTSRLDMYWYEFCSWNWGKRWSSSVLQSQCAPEGHTLTPLQCIHPAITYQNGNAHASPLPTLQVQFPARCRCFQQGPVRKWTEGYFLKIHFREKFLFLLRSLKSREQGIFFHGVRLQSEVHFYPQPRISNFTSHFSCIRTMVVKTLGFIREKDCFLSLIQIVLPKFCWFQTTHFRYKCKRWIW